MPPFMEKYFVDPYKEFGKIVDFQRRHASRLLAHLVEQVFINLFRKKWIDYFILSQSWQNENLTLSLNAKGSEQEKTMSDLKR